MVSRVLKFDVYHTVRAIRAGPREYQYADRPLLSSTSVLTGTEAYFDRYQGIPIGMPWRGR